MNKLTNDVMENFFVEIFCDRFSSQKSSQRDAFAKKHLKQGDEQGAVRITIGSWLGL